MDIVAASYVIEPFRGAVCGPLYAYNHGATPATLDLYQRDPEEPYALRFHTSRPDVTVLQYGRGRAFIKSKLTRYRLERV